MKKLCIVADSLRGGLGAVALEEQRWFAARGWDVVVAGSRSPGSGQAGPIVEISIPRTARDLKGMAKAARELRSLWADSQASIVHCHGLRSYAVARLAGRNAVVTTHGLGGTDSDPFGFPRFRHLAAMVVRGCSISAMSAEYGLRSWTFVPHASPRIQTLERRPMPKVFPPSFLWLGRLDVPKRPDVFVRAIAQANSATPVRGVIAGAGILERELRALAAEVNAPVEFLGERLDVEELIYGAAGVVVLSEFEALCFAIQEAMWAGRPVICSDLPSLRWLVGDAGLIASSVKDVANAIVHLANPAMGRAVGERAAREIRSRLSPDMPWPSIEKEFTRILNGVESAAC